MRTDNEFEFRGISFQNVIWPISNTVLKMGHNPVLELIFPGVMIEKILHGIYFSLT